MAHSYKDNNSTLYKFMCAIVFILFTFIYLYFFQADLLFMIQHVLSGGATHYNRTIGTFIIIVVLYLVQVGTRKIGGLGEILYALTYFPSLVLLTILTGVDSNFSDVPFDGVGLWFMWLLLIAYYVISLFIKFYGDAKSENSSLTIAGALWKNLLCMACMFMAVCMCANSESTFHYRLRVERLLGSDSYAKALRVGERSDDTDMSLTMLRIYALSKSKQLGERLFEYPLVGESKALLPDGKDVRCLFYPDNIIFKSLSIRKMGVMTPMEYLLYIERHGLAMKPVTDYILCGYLLDKNLDGFVNFIRYKYNLESPALPKHYKEALTLYTHLRANPTLVYHSEVMDADYADFQKLESEHSDKKECESFVRDMYGDTYWFYYFYH